MAFSRKKIHFFAIQVIDFSLLSPLYIMEGVKQMTVVLRKKQFKSKQETFFLRKHLHISNKRCNFAADLDGSAHQTLHAT